MKTVHDILSDVKNESESLAHFASFLLRIDRDAPAPRISVADGVALVAWEWGRTFHLIVEFRSGGTYAYKARTTNGWREGSNVPINEPIPRTVFDALSDARQAASEGL